MDVSDTLRLALADRYTIERELGQGGMATVYLAEDLRHHRKVALKVLRPEIAATLGAGRFAREIEVAARLQHPNILPLLDSGEAEGFFFYVMPYVEGESLRGRLARGGELPIHDAVRILMEVADALSHAHAHGVVHRDIKPDNVMLSGRHALVADFGVAKAVTEATGRQVLTSAGVALGTPAYMAPEQATADPHQDHRVDIYALGVLGYELLTGRAPFSATTAQEMLAAHVTAEPEPLEQHRPTVSPTLAAVVMKCLAKKPADRWQTADELLTALEPLATPSGGTTPTQTAPVDALKGRRRMRAAVAGAGLVAVVALGALAYHLLRAKPLAITVTDIAQVTNEPGVEFQPAISPDGNEVAYAAGLLQTHVFVRSTVNVTGAAAVRLGDSTLTSASLPLWSPDGQSVRFSRCRGRDCEMYEVGKLGGASRLVTLPTRRRTDATRTAWSPDGGRLAFAVADTIFTASLADTAVRPLAVDTTGALSDVHSFVWSPDGKLIAYVNGNSQWRGGFNVLGSSIWIVGAVEGERHAITTGDHMGVSPAWLDARHLLFVSNREGPQRGVYIVEVGPKGARGTARLVPGISDPHSISYSTASHKLAWSKFTLRQNVRAYALGRATPVSLGDGRPVTAGNQVVEEHDPSPDGKWVVFDSQRRGSMDLFVVPAAGGDARLLTDLPEDEEGPSWSPDGTEIAYSASTPSGSVSRIGVVPSKGGAPTYVPDAPGGAGWPRWSPDGLHLAFQVVRSDGVAIWLASRDSVGGGWHQPVRLTDFGCYQPEWAPDGSAVLCAGEHWILHLVSRQGRVLWRRELGPPNQLRFNGRMRFSMDRSTMFVYAVHRDGRAGIWAVPVSGAPARLVVADDDPALLGGGAISVGPDHLYVTVSEYESDIWVANLHW